MNEVYLTRAGYEKLHEELAYLVKVRRKELSKAIGEARSHGDISENAEFDAAKDAQAQNERRIADLENKLSRARILDDEDIPDDEVIIGATVVLKDMDTDEDLRYMLVSEDEANYEENKISVSSPVGNALVGHKPNDIVEIQIPAGTLRYKVISISR